MAFTASEKRQIRSFLGYSGGFRDRGVRLESMMDVVGSQAEESAYARELLDQIAEVDEALNDTGTSATSTATYGALKKVDEVEFWPVTETSGASSAASTIVGRDWGEILIERLRALMGVELGGRYFRKTRMSNGVFDLG